MEKRKVEFLLCLFFGYFGVHKYYEGKKLQGSLYTFTLGLFGIGWVVDCIIIGKNAFKKSSEQLEVAGVQKEKNKLENKVVKKDSPFMDLVEKQNKKVEKKKAEKVYQKERIQQLKRDHVPYCPKCKSTSITYMSKRKRLSLGRAVVGGAVGGALTGGLGAAAGATMGGLSSNKMKKGTVKCLNCGHTWKL